MEKEQEEQSAWLVLLQALQDAKPEEIDFIFDTPAANMDEIKAEGYEEVKIS